MSDQQPSFDDDRRDERLREIEHRLDAAERKIGGIITLAGQAMRELHYERERLRELLGMPELGPMAPLYERAAGPDTRS